MATVVCIHGAGGRASDWGLVRAELEPMGHRTLAGDLPCEDETAGLEAYVQAVLDVIDAAGGPPDDLVLVAQSLGGFTAPLVAARVPTRLLVLVTAMIPRPGETGGDWWGNVRLREALDELGVSDAMADEQFLHDVPAEVLAACDPPRDQTGCVMEEPWPLHAWPDVPTRFLLCTDDRFFPPEWMRAVVRERLGIEPDEIPGGHCSYLSQPAAMAAAIDRCWREVDGVDPAAGP